MLSLSPDFKRGKMAQLRSVILFSVLFCALILSCAVSAKEISEYRSIFKPFHDKSGKLKIAIRSLRRSSIPSLVILDPYKFENSVIEESSVDLSKRIDVKEWKATPFIKALYRYTQPENKLQNSGLVAGLNTKGLFLTVDMCPSTKEFDKDLFASTIELPANKNMPVPVAIAVSGLWIEKHRDDFEWVLAKVKDGKLDVTWMNHSYSHPYDSKRHIEENFLLTPGVDFEREALEEEALLLENNITPSPFFRFPGLVSDNHLLEKLRGLSLIPIGANAWLAKGEEPKGGSIILVHGNGNEPLGVKSLIEFYDSNKEEFTNGSLILLPLKDAFRGGK